MRGEVAALHPGCFALAAELPALKTISAAMSWMALATWIATALGLVLACRQRYRSFHQAQPSAA
jgi:hypothetical protein